MNKEAEEMEALLKNSDLSEQKDMEDLKRKFYQTLTWYHSKIPTGFYVQAGKIADELKALNENLKEASEASSKLASALNTLTRWGVIVASLGVAVAFANLFV